MEAKKIMLSSRVTPGEMRKLRTLAAERGVSVSEFVRLVIQQAAGNQATAKQEAAEHESIQK
jgi:hypothetical protein